MNAKRWIYLATAYCAVGALTLLTPPAAFANEECGSEECGKQPLYDEQSQKTFQAGCEALKCTAWAPACDESTNCTWQVRCIGCEE